MNNVMRSFARAALSGLAVLSMTGAASAGPMSVSSGSAIWRLHPRMSNRFATTGGIMTGIIGIIGTTGTTGTTGVMVGTTLDLRLRERLWVSWERLRRVLRPPTPMVTISPMVTINPIVTINPMAMGAGSAAPRPRREFAIAHVPVVRGPASPASVGEAGVTARPCLKELQARIRRDGFFVRPEGEERLRVGARFTGNSERANYSSADIFQRAK